jgi:hypothetical protein
VKSVSHQGALKTCTSIRKLTDYGKKDFSFFLFILFLSALFLLPDFVFSGNPSVIKIEDQKVTLQARAVALNDILLDLANKAHISLSFFGSCNDVVTMEFADMPLERAFKKLLTGYSCTFGYDERIGADGKSLIALSQVFVFSKDASPKNVNLGNQDRASAQPSVESIKPRPPDVSSPVPLQAQNSQAAMETKAEDDGFIKADREIVRNLEPMTLLTQFDAVPRQVNLSPGGAAEIGEKDTAIELAGIEIVRVSRKSLFEQIGLKTGDLIRNVNGRQINRPEQVVEAIQRVARGPGNGLVIRIEIQRGDNVEPIYVKMEENTNP